MSPYRILAIWYFTSRDLMHPTALFGLRNLLPLSLWNTQMSYRIIKRRHMMYVIYSPSLRRETEMSPYTPNTDVVYRIPKKDIHNTHMMYLLYIHDVRHSMPPLSFLWHPGMVCAPEMSAKTPQGRPLGNVKFDFSCLETILQCKLRWRAEDGTGTPQFVLQDDWCCTNMFAPSCCCPVHLINIKTAVGSDRW